MTASGRDKVMQIVDVDPRTPAASLAYVEDAAGATGAFRFSRGRAAHSERTGPSVVVHWDFAEPVTGRSARTRDEQLGPPGMAGESSDANTRIVLLAKKYSRRSFTVEDNARLAILNGRISNVAKLVAEADVDALEQAVDASRRADALSDRLRKKYGL